MKAHLPEWAASRCWVEFEHGGRTWRFLVSPSTYDDATTADEALKARAAAAHAVMEALNHGAP